MIFQKFARKKKRKVNAEALFHATGITIRPTLVNALFSPDAKAIVISLRRKRSVNCSVFRDTSTMRQFVSLILSEVCRKLIFEG